MLPKRQGCRASLLLSAAWLAAAIPAQAGSADALAQPRVVADWRTGLALHGMDPVAYFAESMARIGSSAFEWRWGGAAWRFRNPGNKAAFTANPDVYAPMFVGYDPTAVARDVATPGNPLIWLIRDERLYLFHSPENRDAFSADPERLLAAAEAKWPALTATLPADALLPLGKAPQDASGSPTGHPKP